MYWFSRPPYVRYAAAAAILAVGVFIELRPDTTVQRWFAVTDIEAGVTLDPTRFEPRPAPAGILEWVEPAGRASGPIRAGEPLLPSHVDAADFAVPAGWWALELLIPEAAAAGSEVQLVIRSTEEAAEPIVVPGVVIETNGASDPLGFDQSNGLVAVPAEQAALAAVAVADRRVTLLVAP